MRTVAFLSSPALFILVPWTMIGFIQDIVTKFLPSLLASCTSLPTSNSLLAHTRDTYLSPFSREHKQAVALPTIDEEQSSTDEKENWSPGNF